MAALFNKWHKGMMHVEPSFVFYALLLDSGCCLRAHAVVIGTVEPVEPEEKKWLSQRHCDC